MRAAGAAQLRGDDPGRGLMPGDGEDGHPYGDRDRRLEEEDRLPGDELGEQAADRRAESSPGGAGGRPDRDGAALGADRGRQQLQDRGDRQRASQRLHAAGGDQRAQLGREPAGEAGAGKDGQADRRRAAGADAPRQVRGRNRGQGHHQVEGDEHPGHAGDAGVEVAVDPRQRQDDDRGVGEDEGDGDRERGQAWARRAQ